MHCRSIAFALRYIDTTLHLFLVVHGISLCFAISIGIWKIFFPTIFICWMKFTMPCTKTFHSVERTEKFKNRAMWAFAMLHYCNMTKCIEQSCTEESFDFIVFHYSLILYK
mmetsp:Transcript_726/g.1550  ORF Transcript_726/g.1550 Transcript_726/m.1550 type:complete len:111 (+) Transcript_726:867-1199(+)